MFKDREGEEKWKELNIILGRSRRTLLRNYWKIEGRPLADLSSRANVDDPYLSDRLRWTLDHPHSVES